MNLFRYLTLERTAGIPARIFFRTLFLIVIRFQISSDESLFLFIGVPSYMYFSNLSII